MVCKFGHEHPPAPVTAAASNPTEPWGVRPVHCPTCHYVNRYNRRESNWETYEMEEDIRYECWRSGHRIRA